MSDDNELFPTIRPGQPLELNWRKQDLRMACCECGLVHRIRFTVVGQRLRLRAHEDEEGTEFVRAKYPRSAYNEQRNNKQ